MNKINALSDLAGFVAQSKFASENSQTRRMAVNSMMRNLDQPPMRRKVADLLGTVMALSARTRRLVQPRVAVDIDVFTPDNSRAVRMILNTPEPE